MAKKRKKKSINETPIRCKALAQGPIMEKVKGSPKGKRGYSRKNKSWKNET